ncbi:lactate utilization protein C [Shewanella intestini]|uniref:Lactate utilization protein B/C n=1 Tax=Shewanella intestini TaxID=2017544 RepID=A0ABS5HYC8_9GAMM|nr:MULTISPECIES: LUD domain-containing protein [Shewanella]MBR9726717.1 lactate utilization protein B/C [Shewanella intestini]MRG34717.1 lactate utilization protein B/C [Shewanella sp. XMDDZSB0408]
MTSKDAILSALQNSAAKVKAMPEINIPVINEPLIPRFEQSLATVTATLIKEDGLNALNQHVAELLAQKNQVMSFVDGVQGNRENPELPHQMQDIDYSVLPGKLGVAENGAIWVELPQAHRVTAFICENLIITLSREKIVANMHQAMKQLDFSQTQFGTFISGPSKTADIEQALVVGAHGACSLRVYLID